VGALAVTLAAGCQRDDRGVRKKLDDIDQRLASIEKLVKSGAAGSGGSRHARPERKRPDPKTVYSVPVAGDPYEGPDVAKVTMVKAFDFACPFCARAVSTVAQLEKDYGDKLKVVYKDFVVHPQVATIPALAACAAQKQGKYSQMKDLIWEKGYKANRNLSQENMDKLAKEVGLDIKKYKADMQSTECRKAISEDQAQLRKLGVGGTPTFFINGRPLIGARPIGQFKAVIDEELKKADQRLSKGTKLADYYQKFVVEKGKKSL
jgi:protein-disulfide isomerase